MFDSTPAVLAMIQFELKHHSTAAAKRLLKGAGFAPTTDNLNRLKGLIDTHPQKDEIDRIANMMAEAEQAAINRQLSGNTVDDPCPPWLFSESVDGQRTFITHINPHNNEAFIGEVFDEPDDAPPGPMFPLYDGQVLANIHWLTTAPPDDCQAVLMLTAAKQLAEYEAALGLLSEHR